MSQSLQSNLNKELGSCAQRIADWREAALVCLKTKKADSSYIESVLLGCVGFPKDLKAEAQKLASNLNKHLPNKGTRILADYGIEPF